MNGKDCVYGDNKNIDGNNNKIKIVGGNDSINIFVGGSGDGNRLNNINLGPMSTASGLYININEALYIFILKFVCTGKENNQAPSSYFKPESQLPPHSRYLLSKDDDYDIPIIDNKSNNDKDDDDDIKIIDNPTNNGKDDNKSNTPKVKPGYVIFVYIYIYVYNTYDDFDISLFMKIYTKTHSCIMIWWFDWTLGTSVCL